MMQSTIFCKGVMGTYRNKPFVIKFGATGADTKVYCNGKQLDNVQSVVLAVEAGGTARLTLTLHPAEFFKRSKK